MNAVKIVSTRNMPYEEWLKWRKAGLGGSEAASIAGLNPWSSPLKVYMDKINEEVQGIEDNERMRVGRDLEDYVARRFAEETGKKVRKENYLLQHPEHKFMFANLDRVVVGENAFLECKTTGSYSKSEWEDGIPLHYELQCLHYMAVGGFDYGYIACLIGNEKFIWHKIERDEDTIQNLIKIEQDFWFENVLKQVPPDPDGSDDYSDLIKKKYTTSIPESIELADSYIEKIKRRDEVDALIKDLEQQKKQIDQEIQIAMQDFERAVVGDRVITWKPQNRTSIDSSRLKADGLYDSYAKTSCSRVFKVK